MNGKQSVLSAGDVNLDSRCIDFLRCVLIVFVVLIHTNLVADTSCEDSVYARGYDIMGNLLWLCNPLFFAISGYLFFYSVDFSGKVYAGKMKRRLHSLLVPYFLWNTIYLLLFSAVYQFAPSAIGPYVVVVCGCKGMLTASGWGRAYGGLSVDAAVRNVDIDIFRYVSAATLSECISADACKEFVFRFRPTFHHRTLPDEDFCCFPDVPSDRHTVLPDCPSRQCNHQHLLLRPRVPYYI